MKEKLRSGVILCLTIVVLLFTSSRLPADTGTCGSGMVTLPFTDVAGNGFFCQIAEAFFSGLTNGTTATTYSPSAPVPREQMAAFITRTQDSALTRGSRRAALNQWSTPTSLRSNTRITGDAPHLVASDGLDVWVAVNVGNEVQRFRASDRSYLGAWESAVGAFGVLVAGGQVWVTGNTSPGHLYVIDPAFGQGPVSTRSSTLGNFAQGISTDGAFIWTANQGGSVSRVDPEFGVTNSFSTGFTAPFGILFDGANIWVTDTGDNKLKKLDANGNILQSVSVGVGPVFPVFDGSNIWVPNFNGNSVTVVRVRDGLVLATLTGNGLNEPLQASFDGQRILVTNFGGFSVSLWKATDLTPIGTFSTGAAQPFGACSDGIKFLLTLSNINRLGQF